MNWKEKKKAGRKETKGERLKQKKEKEKKKCAALKLKEKEGWNRERVLNRVGWTDNFSAFIFLWIFSENDGEFVYVEFGF